MRFLLTAGTVGIWVSSEEREAERVCSVVV